MDRNRIQNPAGQLASPFENKYNETEKLLFENLKWLTSREAVVYLRLPSVGALRNLVYQRKIPYAKLGRSLRFDRYALDRFLESSSTNERKVA